MVYKIGFGWSTNYVYWPLPYQDDDIVFRFIIEYSSLKGFWPLGNNNRSILISGFFKDDILACCWNLRLGIEL
jgi:hypothetical protein